LIQVETPRRGKSHACRKNHSATTRRKIKKSDMLKFLRKRKTGGIARRVPQVQKTFCRTSFFTGAQKTMRP